MDADIYIPGLREGFLGSSLRHLFESDFLGYVYLPLVVSGEKNNTPPAPPPRQTPGMVKLHY